MSIDQAITLRTFYTTAVQYHAREIFSHAFASVNRDDVPRHSFFPFQSERLALIKRSVLSNNEAVARGSLNAPAQRLCWRSRAQ